MAKRKISLNTEYDPLIARYMTATGIEKHDHACNLLIGFALNTLIKSGKIPLETVAKKNEKAMRDTEILYQGAKKAALKGAKSLNEYMVGLNSREENALKHNIKDLKNMAREYDDQQELANKSVADAQAKIDLERKVGTIKNMLDKTCLKGMEAFNIVWMPLDKDIQTALKPYVAEWKKDAKRSDKRYVHNGFRPKNRRLAEVEIRKQQRDIMEASE